MKTSQPFRIQLIASPQRSTALRLLHTARHVHQHLDWLGEQTYLATGPSAAAWENEDPVAMLVCPPEASGDAWIRLFAVASHTPLAASFRQLWEAVRPRLKALGVLRVAAMPTGRWFVPVLESSGFTLNDTVVFYEQDLPSALMNPDPCIRRARPADLQNIQLLDGQAFQSIWRHASDAVEAALHAASYSTVLELDDHIAGYQISTENTFGAHLARLAVLPDAQNHGVGSRLVQDLLTYFSRRGMFRVTVNTQSHNLASRHVYEKLGFRQSDLRYPVYDISL